MDTCYIDYDDTVIGRIEVLDSYNYYGSAPGGVNEKQALDIIRYAIEKILAWTPDDAILKFDSYMIRIMNLEKVISYIRYPVEVPYGSTRYILSLLYPDKVHLDREKLVGEVFEDVLESARRKEQSKGTDKLETLKQFPREYFSGSEGFMRFCCCIKYVIENYKPMSSVEEIFSFFCSSQGKHLLYEFRLKVPADQFSIELLSVLRYITREEPDSELYFSYYTFQQEYALATSASEESK